MVEHRPFKAVVVGSSPTVLTTPSDRLSDRTALSETGWEIAARCQAFRDSGHTIDQLLADDIAKVR